MALVTISNTPLSNRRLADIFRHVVAICDLSRTGPVKLPEDIGGALRAEIERLPSAELETVRGSLLRIVDHVEAVILERIAAEDRVTDALVDRQLREARERANESMAVPESIRQGQAFMAKMHGDAAIALMNKVERKELLTAEELKATLQAPARWIRDAAKAGRLFAVESPSGDAYYPAFYTDPRYDRQALKKVAKRLGNLPGASKHHFFTQASQFLERKTPLDALAEGRVTEVVRAAAAYAER